MKVRICSTSLIVVAILMALVPPFARAQSPETETSITVTDVVSGAPLVGKNFTTDLQVSITNVVTSTVGVLGVEIWVSFDPTVVSVYDFDGNAGNGTQVEVKNGFFDGNLVIVANEVFTDTPTIPHPTECDAQACIHMAASHTGGSGPMTNTTGTVATITWVGLAEGSPAIGIPVVETGIPPGSVLSDEYGEAIPIDSTSVPDITVTYPGTIEGTVQRQGTRTDNAGVEIVAQATGGVLTTTTTTTNGSFSMELPLGGTYAVNASYPGYLHAQKDSVYVVGTTVDIGTTKLVAGDVNADNCINILDIVSIIGKFGQTGLPISDPQDINDDGTINIFDLTVAAGNFGRCGPTAWAP
ncbi:MAG: carboxypeptidase regulatory-like domain-containing protein [Anaerolineae bacterium]